MNAPLPLADRGRALIQEFTIYDENRSMVWRSDTDLARPEGGSRECALLIELDMDGQSDVVHADLRQSGDLVSIERAIVVLTRLRDRLSQMYDGGARMAGRCWAQGDWGRCGREDGHGEDHDFPTESDWESLHLLQTRAARDQA